MPKKNIVVGCVLLLCACVYEHERYHDNSVCIALRVFGRVMRLYSSNFFQELDFGQD